MDNYPQNVSLIPTEKANEETIRRVREFASLLPVEKAQEYKAIITNYQPKSAQSGVPSHKIYTILLRENSESIRHKISRILNTPTFYISFYTDEAMIFDILWRAAYPRVSQDGENLEEAIANRGTSGNGVFGNDFDADEEDRGVLPEEPVADDSDASGRQILTDEEEFERNSNKKLSELASIELARLILWEFIRSGGSDLYLEPQGKVSRIRIMIDDELTTIRENIPKIRGEDLARCFIGMSGKSSYAMRQVSVDSAIKVRAKVGYEVKDIEFRFHSHPTVEGTSCVIRSQVNKINDFEKTGLLDLNIKNLRRAGNERQGLVLITGATGSGKSITLECLYHEHEQKGTLKIIEITDTVEFVSPYRDQIEINEMHGLSWDDALRACLRSKPHIIGIGEMRSKHETVKAVEAAMTGHLVMATYHAGNVLKTLERLRMMDVDILQLAPSLNIIHSQILIRKLCANPDCRLIDRTHSKEFGKTVYRAGKGCEECKYKGYKGKLALAESLIFTEEVEDMFIAGVEAKEILTEMRKLKNFTPLSVTARKLVYDGVTSVEQVKYMLGKVYDQFYGDDNWFEDEVFQTNAAEEKRFNENGIELDEEEAEELLSYEKKVGKLKKLKNLAERGAKGEKEVAQKQYSSLIVKWGIPESELVETVSTNGNGKKVHYR